MTLSQSGINYICQNYGNTVECVVSQAWGLTFDYTDVLGESYTGMTGSTAEIVGFVISGLIDTITMTNPSRPPISNPQAAINNANGSAVNMADAQSLIQHDETSGDQWCYAAGAPTGSAAFTVCPSAINGTITAYFTWQGAIQPSMDDIAYMYIKRPDGSKAVEYVEDTYGQTSGNHILTTTANQTGAWKAHIDIANGAGVWVTYEATCQVGGGGTTGACCIDETCSITTKAACTGTYKGNGTTCSPNPCLQPVDCNTITDPALCIMPTCFWYKDYIWETGEGATCHDLMEMLTDNWFIPVGVGALILWSLLKG